jgi:anti-anti-sigma regulatory factor
MTINDDDLSCSIATAYRPEGIAVVTVDGACGDADAVRLKALFDDLFQENLPAVIVDLSGVEVLGPNGLYAMLDGQRAAADIGLPMVAVVDMAAAIESPESPQLAALHNSMDTYPTLEKALAGLEG